MADKKITLHPKDSNGQIEQSINVYPKTTIDQVYSEDGQTPFGNNYFQKALSAGLGISLTNNIVSVDPESQSLKDMLLEMLYPKGAIYTSTTIDSNNKCPIENSLGGTWERIKDTFLLAAGDTYAPGSSGGDATVTLEEANLPSHRHSFSANSITDGTYDVTSGTSKPLLGKIYFRQTDTELSVVDHVLGSPFVKIDKATGNTGPTMTEGYQRKKSDILTIDATHKHTFTVSGNTGYVGSGTPHNNMPPYITVYVWKRVS